MKFQPFLVLLLSSIILHAQSGGESVFQILNLPPSSRALSLGNRIVSARDSDVAFAQINPAVAENYSTHQVSFNHSFYYSGSSFTTVNSMYHLSRQNITLLGGLYHLSYGDLQGTDEFGNTTNLFKASENIVALGAAKKLFESLSLGVNFKYILSTIESYSSTGLGMDIGTIYRFKNHRQQIGLVAKNIGVQFSPYSNLREPLPFDMVVGFSQRLAHVPIQFHLSAHHLLTWKLRTIEPETISPIFGEPIAGPSAFSKTMDNLFRHLVFGTEIFLGRHAPLRLRLSYDHQRHQELKDQTYRSLAGFGGGVGIKFGKFVVDYGFANYHLAGSINALGISYRW